MDKNSIMWPPGQQEKDKPEAKQIAVLQQHFTPTQALTSKQQIRKKAEQIPLSNTEEP